MRLAETIAARYRAALQQRQRAAPEAVQRALAARLALAEPEVPAEAPASEPVRAARTVLPPAPATPLAQLNRHIADASGQALAARAELRSAVAFRETWERLCAEEQVVQAVQRGPENPGPLNSHMLMLRTLSLLSDLSPDYLRRFMSQADTLLWLEAAAARLRPAPAGKTGKPAKGRAKK